MAQNCKEENAVSLCRKRSAQGSKKSIGQTLHVKDSERIIEDTKEQEDLLNEILPG